MKKDKFVNAIPAFVVSGLAAMIGLMVIYAIRGIYPFGSKNIAYYDMSQSIIPLYYHTYDVLHGTEAFFWDWYSGLGIFVTDTAGNFIFSPFNLFFFFVKRDMILESMSFFLVLKVCCCAGVMSFFTQKRFPSLDKIWHVFFGIIYATSGFAIQYYTSIYYLDIVVLFPLIIYFLEELLENEKKIGFIIVMAIGFVISLYLMFMVCFFLLLYSCLRMRELPKEQRGSKTTKLGIAVMVSGCISAFVLVPTTIQLLNSPRADVAGTMSSLSDFYSYLDLYFGNKLFMLFGAELPIALILFYIVIRRDVIKKHIGWLLLAILLVIPIKIEYINAAWHPGGYVQFPMRYGYMLTFTFAYLMARFMEKGNGLECEPQKGQKVLQYLKLFTFAAIPFLVFVVINYFQMFHEYGTRDTSAFTTYKSTMIIICIVYLLVLLTLRGKMRVYACGMIVCLQFVAGWNGMLAPESMYSPECTDSIIVNSENIYDSKTHTDVDRINRVKDVSNSLNANYTFILRKAAISNWTFGSKTAVRDFLTTTGYSESYNRLLDNGGTVFVDSLLNVNDIITTEKPDEALFEVKETTAGGYFLSELKQSFLFGIVTQGDGLRTLEEGLSPLDSTNSLYRKLTGGEEDLIHQYELSEFELEEQDNYNLYHYSTTVDISEESLLYLQIPDQTMQYMIYVNGNTLTMPALEIPDNQLYPNYNLTGLISCGRFENGVVDIEIIAAAEPHAFATIGVLNLSKMYDVMDAQNKYERTIETGKTSLSMSISVDADDQYLMIPISYDAGYQVTLNGKKIKCSSALNGAFIYVPLVNGANQIDIHFTPNGLKIGCIISVLGLLFGGLFLIFDKQIVKVRAINSVAYVCLWLCTFGMLAYIYAWQLIRTILLYTKVLKYYMSMG